MNLWAGLLRQPVLVFLFAAFLALFGLAALLNLPVRSGPIIPVRMIDITTNFPGAAAPSMDKFVTLPLEAAITPITGVKYVTGTTQPGNSDINAVLTDDAAPNTVFAQIQAAVAAARSNLPPGIQSTNISLVGDDNANQELNPTILFPASASQAAVTAYAKTDIIPRLETIPGIGPVRLFSDDPALHVRLDPVRMQAMGITSADVAQSLGNASAVNPAGQLRDNADALPVDAQSGLNSPEDFGNLPIATRHGVTIPLGSIAQPELGFSDGTDTDWWDRRPAIYLAAGIAPAGNIITVAAGMRKLFAALTPSLPPGLKLLITYDESRNVVESLRDLAITLAITILLVGFIVRLSLGSLRAAAAPFMAIILSLLGAAIVMQATGQSLNLFTIIALVLAVGLVVDDAIVVVEDIFRRVQEGEAPLAAATSSTRRLAPVLAAISSTLVVAFLPLAFLEGLTAALFRPFALVLISAFLLSLVIALTIVPAVAMWASQTSGHGRERGLINRLREAYIRTLGAALRLCPAIAGGVLVAALLCLVLLHIAPKNLVPAADGLNVDIYANAPNGASMGYLKSQAAVLENILHQTLPDDPDWLVASENQHTIFGGYTFNSPEQAARKTIRLTSALASIPGLQTYVSQENGMPGTEDLPIAVNISGQTNSARLLALATQIENTANATGKFNYLVTSPGQPQYQLTLTINRPLAARLGIDDTQIGTALSTSLSGGNLGQVNLQGATLNITTELPSNGGAAMLAAIPLRTANGALVPLGTVATLNGSELPDSLGSWQGLPSITILGQPALGVPLGAALAELRADFIATGADDLSFGYSGPSEIFQDSQSQNTKLFALGLLGLFFLLAAQFQSLRDPFVVITTVPLASLGPLLLFVAGGATLNIVTEIALLTVWGLIARQGILFVQIAHEGRALNLNLREAALRAASLRFRPILMITLALVGGAIPLILASGPQAVIRYDLGVVLATGMGSGFLLSLFAVPSMYCLLHRKRYG